MKKALVRARWLILYVVTVAALLWWYEIRPASVASRQLQGMWRALEGTTPNERFRDSYLHVHDDETWLLYPFADKWNVVRSRITVRPADNFFVVQRAIGFDYGNTRETEYIVCLKNDELYLVRGLAQFDPAMQNTIEKLRRVDSMPEDALEAVEAYLDRRARMSSDEPGCAGQEN